MQSNAVYFFFSTVMQVCIVYQKRNGKIIMLSEADWPLKFIFSMNTTNVSHLFSISYFCHIVEIILERFLISNCSPSTKTQFWLCEFWIALVEGKGGGFAWDKGATNRANNWIFVENLQKWCVMGIYELIEFFFWCVVWLVYTLQEWVNVM